MADDDEYEDDDEQPCISMTVPLFIRLLEFAREDARNDMVLHKVAEAAIELHGADKEVLDMDDYGELVEANKGAKDDKPKPKPGHLAVALQER